MYRSRCQDLEHYVPRAHCGVLEKNTVYFECEEVKMLLTVKPLRLR